MVWGHGNPVTGPAWGKSGNPNTNKTWTGAGQPGSIQGTPPVLSLASFVGPVPSQYNMLLWSNNAPSTDFANVYWTPQASSVSSGIKGPDNNLTAYRLVEDATSANHSIAPAGIGKPSGGDPDLIPWRAAVIARASQRTRIVVQWGMFNDPTDSLVRVGFNLNGGTVYSTSAGANITILNTSVSLLTGGWYLCTFDFQYSNPPARSFVWTPRIYIDAGSGNASVNINYQGNGSAGVDLWWWNMLPVQAWSINSLDFFDDFTSLGTIDLQNTKRPGYNWYINNNWPNAIFQNADLRQGPSPPFIFTLSSPSVLQINNPNNNVASYTSNMMTAVTNGGNGYIGKGWNGPAVFDCLFTYDQSLFPNFNGQATNPPAFWGESLEMRCNNSLNAAGNFIELDHFEAFSNNSSTVWSFISFPGFSTASRLTSDNLFTATPTTFQRMSSMWITMKANNNASGIFLFFLNGQFYAGVGYSPSLPAGNAWYLTDGQHLPVILITAENTTSNPGGGLPFLIDYVKVYIDPRYATSGGFG